jgi:ADP-glucose pyrophosphorylase
MLNSHLATCYPPVVISNPAKQGFVDVLACHQTIGATNWYRGSADAVRANMPTILDTTMIGEEPRDVLILSGHAVYDMVSTPTSPSQSNE